MIINKQLYIILLTFATGLMIACNSLTAYANDVAKIIQLNPNFGKPIRLPESAATIAIGDPNIADVVTVEPDLLMLTGQNNGSTSMTIIGKSGDIYQYTLLVSSDITQLRTLISSVGPNVIVDTIKGKILLKGTVETAAQLTRVLTIADRYMGGKGSAPSFNVISDQGGILAGNLPGTRALSINGVNANGGGGGVGGGGVGGGGVGGGGVGGGGATAATRPISPDGKANLAQNIARASVLSVANGQVISMIKVINQPKVEIQMRIVEVDRSKTDEFGIDWQLDGNNVTIASFAGDVVSTTQSNNNNSVNIGTADLVGLFSPGRYTLSAFVRALEEKGATTTLSEPLLTAISGEATNFLVGGSVPIPTQTQTSSFNNVATATNVQYINFGLAITVRPTVLENGKINIVLDQSMSSLDYGRAIQILGTDVPAFNQKTISTVTESSSGETWAVAGLLTEEDRKRLQSVPWVSKIPVLGKIFKNNNDSTSRNELIILVNARRVDSINSTTTSFSGRGKLEPYSNIRNTHQDGNELDSQIPYQKKNINKKQKVEKNIRSIEIKRDPIKKPEAQTKYDEFKDLPALKPLMNKRSGHASISKGSELNSDLDEASKVKIIHLNRRVKSAIAMNNIASINTQRHENKNQLEPTREKRISLITNDNTTASIKTASLSINQKDKMLSETNKKHHINSVVFANTRGVSLKIAYDLPVNHKIVLHNFLVGDEKTAYLNNLRNSKNKHDMSGWRVASGSYVNQPEKEVLFVIKPKYNQKVYSGAVVSIDSTFDDNYLVAVNYSNT